MEERLVLDSACADVQAEAVARIRAALSGNVNWTIVAEVAERHRVTPLLLKTLEAIAPAAVRYGDAAVLRSRTRLIARRTLELTREMLALVRSFESDGIATVPLKGPMLALRAFGSLASREFADIDLLVKRKDLARGCALLEEAGYRRELQLSPRREAAYLRSEHAWTYHRERENLTVELHWRLQDRYLSFPLSERDLWANVESEECLGVQIRCLRPEYELLYLCMHGAKHSWERLEWISCFHALVLRQPLANWPAVIATAGRLHSTRLLHLGLMLADGLSSSNETRTPLRLISGDSTMEDLTATVWARMFASEMTGSPREVYRFRFYLKAREHLRDRLRVVWNLAVRIPHPNSLASEKNGLPASLLFMNYFLSPLGFVRKFGFRGLRGILRPERDLRRSIDWLAGG